MAFIQLRLLCGGGVPFKEHKRILAHSTTFVLIKDIAKKRERKDKKRESVNDKEET